MLIKYELVRIATPILLTTFAAKSSLGAMAVKASEGGRACTS